MDGGIKWLASYPKSLNTLARLRLLNYHADLNEPLNPNELGRTRFCPSCDTPWLWKDATGLEEVNEESSFKLRRWVQDYYRRMPGDIPPYLKTHTSNTFVGGVFPYVNWEVTDCAVYLIRDPRKIAPSLADHMGWGLDEVIEKMADPDYFAGGDGRPFYHIGSWSDHVNSWKERAIVIRAEDFVESFDFMLRAFGLAVDERSEKARAFTDMNVLRKFERESGFAEAVNGQTFFGGRRRELSKAQKERIEETHEKVMREFGYL